MQSSQFAAHKQHIVGDSCSFSSDSCKELKYWNLPTSLREENTIPFKWRFKLTVKYKSRLKSHVLFVCLGFVGRGSYSLEALRKDTVQQNIKCNYACLKVDIIWTSLQVCFSKGSDTRSNNWFQRRGHNGLVRTDALCTSQRRQTTIT